MKFKEIDLLKQGILMVAVFLFPLTISASTTDTIDFDRKLSLLNTMQYQEILPVTLELDIEEVLANRRTKEKIKAVLSFENAKGELQTWDTKLQVRGRFRRMECAEMPPLKMDFSKKDLEAAGLAAFDDMKLVTHCVEDEALAKELLMKEYLAYKLYNQISEESFKVQFLKITYVDTKTGEKMENHAFLIEDTAELRSRIGATKLEKNIDSMEVDQKAINQLALFQCMIGNVDWNFDTQHNLKVMVKNGKVIAVPYDFDFSGFVHAPYARLKMEIGQTSLNDRIFLREGVNDKELELLRVSISENEEAFIQTINDTKGLNGRSKRECILYLKDFFKGIVPIKNPKNSL